MNLHNNLKQLQVSGMDFVKESFKTTNSIVVCFVGAIPVCEHYHRAKKYDQSGGRIYTYEKPTEFNNRPVTIMPNTIDYLKKETKQCNELYNGHPSKSFVDKQTSLDILES